MSTSDLLDLGGRVALVTGAGQGVGRAIALRLAEHGAGAVVVNDYYAERADAVAAEIESLGCKALGIAADVTDRDAVNHMFDDAATAFGPVGILVNNAGNMGPHTPDTTTPFWEQTPELWERSIGVNLYGVMYCAQAALPGMIEQKAGSIITIVSDAGRVGEPGLEAYSAAKAGAAGFVRALARGVGKFGIRANCVSLSATNTPTVPVPSADSEIGQKILRPYIIRRFGEPEDAANMVLMLAGDATGWVTGQTIPVNGGFALAL